MKIKKYALFRVLKVVARASSKWLWWECSDAQCRLSIRCSYIRSWVISSKSSQCQYVNSENSYAHHSWVEKQEKLSGSHLSGHLPVRINTNFQILLCQMDVSTFSWQTNVTKMCPKYLLTLHQNWSSQYQIQINRTGDINNVKIVEVWTLCANRNIHYPPFTGLSGCADKSAAELYETTTTIWPSVCPISYVLLFRAAYDLKSWPSGKRIRLWNPRSRVDSRVGTYYRLFFFFLFLLVMQNHFIQVIWNYINSLTI